MKIQAIWCLYKIIICTTTLDPLQSHQILHIHHAHAANSIESSKLITYSHRMYLQTNTAKLRICSNNMTKKAVELYKIANRCSKWNIIKW
jgi:hypothetical protein